jgi:hypothetical protein
MNTERIDASIEKVGEEVFITLYELWGGQPISMATIKRRIEDIKIIRLLEKGHQPPYVSRILHVGIRKVQRMAENLRGKKGK